MPSLKALARTLFTALQWALAWGLTGAAAGVVMILVEPDTGHIGRSFVPIMVGIGDGRGGLSNLGIISAIGEFQRPGKSDRILTKLAVGDFNKGAASIQAIRLMSCKEVCQKNVSMF